MAENPSLIARTGARYPIDAPRWRADDGGPLAVSPLPGIEQGGIDRAERSLWRYAAALPFAVERPASLGAGCTPLVAMDWRGVPVRFKLEWFAPTGSFKDRGASVMISMLRQQGVGHVLEDSSGNGGAAIAAFAAAAGMRATVLAPAYAQPHKIAQIRAFGAEVELVEGSREDVQAAALARAAEIFYASHNWHPFFLQGTKTLAYELWEDLGFKAPDNVIVATGAGSNVLGADIGFGELLARGLIDRLPRLYAVQPAACAPVAAAFAAGAADVARVEPRDTVAEGTRIPLPVRGPELLAALYRSGGAALAVEEPEIVDAYRRLARAGLYAEPTSAVAVAGLERLLAAGTIRPGECTVVVLTGTGLKATGQID